MRRVILISVGVMFLVACAQASTPPALSPTATPLPSTGTPVPTETAFPTGISTITAAATTAFILPALEPVTISPFALNETNAGSQMKLLGLLGTGRPTDIAFSPDGNSLAISTMLGLHLYDQGGLGEPSFYGLDYFKVDQPITALAFGDDGLSLALAQHGQISLWSLSNRRLERAGTISSGELGIFQLFYEKDGRIAAWGMFPGDNVSTLSIWEAATGTKIFSIRGVNTPAFNPDGTLLAFGTDTGLRLVDTNTWKTIAEKNLYPDSLGFGPDGTSLVAIRMYQKGMSVTWDFVRDEQTPLADCPLPMAWSGNALLCGEDGKIFLIDLAAGRQMDRLAINPTYNGSALRPDGSLLAMLDYNYDLHIIDPANGSQLRFIPMGSFEASAENKDIAVGIIKIDNKDARLVAAADRAGDIRLWKLEQSGGYLLCTLRTGINIVGVAFSPDKRTVASLDTNGFLKFWDVPAAAAQATSNGMVSSTPLATFGPTSSLLPGGQLTGPIAFSPAGTRLALFTDSGKYLLDLQFLAYEQWGSINLANPEGAQFFFMPDGSLLDYRLENGSFSLVNASTGEVVLPSLDLHENAGFGGYSSEVESSAIRLDGSLFAYATQEGVINIWDLAAAKLVNSFKGQPKITTMANIRSVSSLAFNPGSNLLATTGADYTTRLWNFRTGAQLRQFDYCCYTTFTPDGQFFIIAGGGALRFWGINQ